MEYHVAPMKGYTCWAFRSSCLGATDSYTEMIQLWEIIKKKPRAMKILDLFPIPYQNQWIQVLTNSPKEMKKLPAFLDNFAKKNPDRANIYGININAGCPDPQIIRAGHGSALIKRRKRIMDLAKTFFQNPDHNYKLSYKFRLGMNSKDVEYKVIVDVLNDLKMIEDSRIFPSIIHFKHAKQNSDDPPIWDMLEPILECNVPIILNGGIQNKIDIEKLYSSLPDDFKSLWDENVKGIMVGRGLFQNPFMFFKNFSNPSEIPQGINDVAERYSKDWRNLLTKNLKRHTPPNYFTRNLKNL
jgi:tRNA-dihydrouridine synthase